MFDIIDFFSINNVVIIGDNQQSSILFPIFHWVKLVVNHESYIE